MALLVLSGLVKWRFVRSLPDSLGPFDSMGVAYTEIGTFYRKWIVARSGAVKTGVGDKNLSEDLIGGRGMAAEPPHHMVETGWM